MATSPTNLRLAFAGKAGCATPHLSVDGMTPQGPNLSHWPGNRTPRQWKADLSTGIALRFARAAARDQAQFLAGVDVVLNDHYDTDGYGALLAVLRPEVAMRHEELLLAAAAVGDFGMWGTQRAFQIDRAIRDLAAPHSPVAREFAGIGQPDALALARYQWLIAHADELLRAPEAFAALSDDEAAQIQLELDRDQRGGMDLRAVANLGLAVLRTVGPRHRMTLNTLAGAYRVLHLDQRADGLRVRYHDRTESWFELVTLRTLPRQDLRPLAACLQQLEPEHDGGRWCADSPTEPIPELYFGIPSTQEYGQINRTLLPTRLPAERIVAAVVEHFAVAQ